MVAAYLFFFYILIFGPGWYCVHDLARFRACITGLFTTYALGFLGYTILPAGGPHLSMTQLPPHLASRYEGRPTSLGLYFLVPRR